LKLEAKNERNELKLEVKKEKYDREKKETELKLVEKIGRY